MDEKGVKKQIVKYYVNKRVMPSEKVWEENLKSIVEKMEIDDLKQALDIDEALNFIIPKGVLRNEDAKILIKKGYHKDHKIKVKLLSLVLKDVEIESQDEEFLRNFKELIFDEDLISQYYGINKTQDFKIMKVRYIVDRLYDGDERVQIAKGLYKQYIKSVYKYAQEYKMELGDLSELQDEGFSEYLKALDNYYKKITLKYLNKNTLLKKEDKITLEVYRDELKKKLKDGIITKSNRYIKLFKVI